jgi:serine/threonine protein kinase
MSIANCDFCPEFDRWQQLRACGIAVVFRRILRIDSEFGDLSDYMINDSVFEEESIFGVFDQISIEIYHRCVDGSSIIDNTLSGMKSMESLRIEIENQLNLCHPCILAFLDQSVLFLELYSEGNSLTEVISMNPVWCTAKAKAKAIAGIVLSLGFAHSLGLIHGHRNSKNIVFDVDHRIQITDCYPIRLEGAESE